MLITTVFFYVAVRERWGWSRARAAPLCAVFFVVDVAFFSATLFKIPRGGWLPLVVAALVFTLLTTWRTGHRLTRERRLRRALPLEEFVGNLKKHPPVRAPGTAAILFPAPGVTPPVLLATLRHLDALPERVLILSIQPEDRPRVHPVKRPEVLDLGEGFVQVVLRFGYFEEPNVPKALEGRVSKDLGLDLDTMTYLVGRESVRVTSRPGMAWWREHLYAVMARNATDPASYFRLPPDQVFELGVIVEI
jgi:KUP system potassium uptake protein